MHRRRSLDPRLALAWLVAAGCAPIPPSSRVEIPVRQFTVGEAELPSGLKVIVETDPAARAVASAVVVHAGGAQDPTGQEGLAHLVEHLTFRAHATNQPSLATAMALRGVGLWNGETEMDVTTYYEAGAPETIGSIIEAESRRLSDPLQGVDETTFEVERGVVLSELRWRDESGVLHEAQRALYAQLFPLGHVYARGVGGSPASVAKLTLAQASAWARTHYVPRRMTWVIAGPIDVNHTVALLEKLVPDSLRAASPIPAETPRPAAGLSSPPPAPETLTVVHGPVRRPTLRVAWLLPAVDARSRPVYEVLSELVDDWYPAGSAVDTNLVEMDDATVLEMVVELRPEAKPDEFLKSIRFIANNAWGGGTLTSQYWMEEGFAQLRAASVVGLARESESVLARTVLRARRARDAGGAKTLKSANDAVAKLTYRDVLATGQKYVTGDLMRAVLVRPTDEVGAPEQSAVARASSAFAPEVLRVEYPRDVVNRFAKAPTLAQLTQFTASNGLEVIVVPEKGSGLVSLTLGVRGGTLTSTPPALNERAWWSTQKFDYHSPAWIGASAWTRWTDDSGLLQYQGGSGNLPNLLAMLGERLLTFEVQEAPKTVLASAEIESEQRAFRRRFASALLGDPAGHAIRPVAEQAAMDRGATQRWIEQVFDPNTSVLVIAGEVGPDVRDHVEHWLGRWHGRGGAPARAPSPPSGPGALRVVKANKPGAADVRVRFGCAASGTSPEDEIAFELIATDLEQQWSRLERDALGSSYGFHASTSFRRDGVMSLEVTGQMNRNSARRMAVAVSQAWKSLGDSGEAKLDRLRWEYARKYNVRYLTLPALAQDLVWERLRGRPASALTEVPAALARVDGERMKSVGGQCRKSAVLGLLGDPAALDVAAQLPPDARSF
ncbi:MAG TPA: insulinase family protein [Myxococcaceae bacterium]